MKLLIVILTLALTACATPPQFLANHYNKQDPCQHYGKVDNYQLPDYCYKNYSYNTYVIERVGPGVYNVRR